jgi:hypothetical protein
MSYLGHHYWLLLLSCSAATALCAACADDDFDVAPTGGTTDAGPALTLSATKQHLVTRSGDVVETFQEGSDFRLFAAKGDTWYQTLYGSRGLSAADGSITYSPVVSYLSNKDSLDFYAVAVDRIRAGYSTETGDTIPVVYTDSTAVGGGAPRLIWQWGDGLATAAPEGFERPGDLMISNTVKGKTQRNGTVTLPFRHALTRLTFEVSKVDETSIVKGATDKTYWLDSVSLLGIDVIGTHRRASLNLCTGAWTLLGKTETMSCDSTGWSYADAHNEDLKLPGMLLTTTATPVNDSLLLFPNGNEMLTLSVTLFIPKLPQEDNVTFLSSSDHVCVEELSTGGYKATVQTKLNRYDLGLSSDTKDSATPFACESNYSYKFSIVAMRNDVRILVIAPTVYEWVEEDLVASGEAIMGQPVTFGGLMWMDRNLGASTNDAANDFYGAIGYYYQYGRNIPYIMDVTKLVDYIDDDDENDLFVNTSLGFPVILKTTTAKATDKTSPYRAWSLHGKSKQLTDEKKAQLDREQVECFYTYDLFGDTVYGGIFITEQDSIYLIRYVGDKLYKTDKPNEIDTAKTHHYYRLSTDTESSRPGAWTFKDYRATGYWLAQADQPCPKGWRLPTHKDLYSFMPWGNVIQWGSYQAIYAYFPDKTVRCGSLSYWDFTKDYSNGDAIADADSLKDSYGAVWKNGTVGWYRKDQADADTGMEGWTQECRFGQIVKADGTFYNAVFMLKYKGREQAYRIRILSQFSKGYHSSDLSKNKRYITISRYSAEVGKTIDDYVQDGKYLTEWENPIETIQYPCAGFIVTDGTFDLRSFGDGIVLRTSESSGNLKSQNSWVQYLSTTNFNVSVQNSSRRSLGDQVRCCRDISASD